MLTSEPSPTHLTTVTRRLNGANAATASSIMVTLMIASAQRPHALMVLGACLVLTFALNLWMASTAFRDTLAADNARAVLNISVMVASGFASGWAFPVWGFLPFTAIILGQRSRGYSVATLVLTCAAMDVPALLDGVAYTTPLSSTLLAAGLFQISRLRFSVTQRMVVGMERQYGELARVHDDLRRAHDAVTEEVTARKRVESELLQAQKLEAVGRLAAGIAHELNTPVQFVNDNITFVNESMQDLAAVMAAYRELREKVARGSATAEDAEQLVALEAERDLAFIEENIPMALTRSVDGLTRVATIVRSMKEFAHPARKDMALADINRAIRSTLDVARNEYKYVANLETDLADIPQVMCFLGDLNQVVLNLLVNAAHAIGDVVKDTADRGTIKVTTRLEGGHVVIRISDTGTGIPEAAQKHIFEPFFTTKAVGKGTGQGLAISRQVVVEKHGGTLSFETEPGRGTTFIIRIPARVAENDMAPPSAA
jgi:signal transduction histidine kinase